jgi:hypothetical protein
LYRPPRRRRDDNGEALALAVDGLWSRFGTKVQLQFRAQHGITDQQGAGGGRQQARADHYHHHQPLGKAIAGDQEQAQRQADADQRACDDGVHLAALAVEVLRHRQRSGGGSVASCRGHHLAWKPPSMLST